MKKYRLTWCSDLHFDSIQPDRRRKFLDSLVSTGADGVLITGDISLIRRVAESLTAIAGTNLTTYFVPGNHDYYTASFAQTDAIIASVSRDHTATELPMALEMRKSDHPSRARSVANVCL